MSIAHDGSRNSYRDTVAQFVAFLWPHAVAVRDKGKPINVRAAVAQAGLESGWGRSYLARAANNYFGIKAGKSWKGPVIELWGAEFGPGGYRHERFRWRRYASPMECLEDYTNIISGLPWFRDCLPHADPPLGDGDATRWFAALLPRPGEPGWATDPKYFRKLISVLNQVDAVRSEMGLK